MPPKKPTTVPARERARYFAAKSQLNDTDSTPNALSVPSSFSSFLTAVLMVNVTVMNTMTMRNSETIIMIAFMAIVESSFWLNSNKDEDIITSPN